MAIATSLLQLVAMPTKKQLSSGQGYGLVDFRDNHTPRGEDVYPPARVNAYPLRSLRADPENQV